MEITQNFKKNKKRKKIMYLLVDFCPNLVFLTSKKGFLTKFNK